MKFEYTGRHVEVSPAIRRHVEDHFKKLDHIFNGDSTLNTHVIIDVEKNRQIGEIVVNWREYTLTAKDTNAQPARSRVQANATKLLLNLIRVRAFEGALHDCATLTRPGDLHLIAILRHSSTR